MCSLIKLGCSSNIPKLGGKRCFEVSWTIYFILYLLYFIAKSHQQLMCLKEVRNNITYWLTALFFKIFFTILLIHFCPSKKKKKDGGNLFSFLLCKYTHIIFSILSLSATSKVLTGKVIWPLFSKILYKFKKQLISKSFPHVTF